MLRHACGFALANKGMIRGLFRPTWGTRTSSTRCAILCWRLIASRTSGGEMGWRSDRANPENGADQDRGYNDPRQVNRKPPRGARCRFGHAVAPTTPFWASHGIKSVNWFTIVDG